MHPRKLKYTQEIFSLINTLCANMSDEKNTNISDVLAVSNEDMFELIKKVMIALPDDFFYNAPPAMLHDLLGFIAKNLILFQVQEDIEKEHYTLNFINFINKLTTSIVVRYYQKSQLRSI